MKKPHRRHPRKMYKKRCERMEVCEREEKKGGENINANPFCFAHVIWALFCRQLARVLRVRLQIIIWYIDFRSCAVYKCGHIYYFISKNISFRVQVFSFFFFFILLVVSLSTYWLLVRLSLLRIDSLAIFTYGKSYTLFSIARIHIRMCNVTHRWLRCISSSSGKHHIGMCVSVCVCVPAEHVCIVICRW